MNGCTVQDILQHYSNDESIIKIKANNEANLLKFNFKPIEEDVLKKIILNLNSKKGALHDCIPVTLLKDSCDVYISQLNDIIIHCLENNIFPNKLKLADVIPIFKKADSLKKENYRPVSLLSHISKILERVIYDQINGFMEPKFSNFLTGFRKNHNTQMSLLKMIEHWKSLLDNGFYIGAIFMDLSKAFDTLNHSLLLAKLSAYGFSSGAIKLMKSYLSERLQRTNINGTFSTWKEIFTGVPQGSILGPLLFNIFINDIFYFTTNCSLCDYADDNTLYAFDRSHETMKCKLQIDFEILDRWFQHNIMVLNPDKCHFMNLGPKSSTQSVNDIFCYKEIKLKSSCEEKLLGVIIDKDLNFNNHVKAMCRTAGKKLNTLARVSNILNESKKELLFNSFIKGQFNYCPLIWMFSSRSSNSHINKIHERALRICKNNYDISFETLLNECNEVTIHVKNLRNLLTEVYKYLNRLSPPIMQELFETRTLNYNLRNFRVIETYRKNTIAFGIETVTYKSSQLWQILPTELKSIQSLHEFKRKVKEWKGENCPCRLCKIYIRNLGYLE